MTPKQWDPEKPDLLHATGAPKKTGGWMSWLIGLGALAAILVAWFWTR